MPVSARALYAWHERPGAFRRLAPPWTAIRPVKMPNGLNDGDRAEFQVRLGPIWKTWIAEHREVVSGAQFRDVQVKGPFKSWSHLHRFEAVDANTSILDDSIEFTPPGGRPAQLALGRYFARDLERMFAHRHRTTRQDLAFHRHLGLAHQRVLVSGATGLIGSHLSAFLRTGGHEVRALVRGRASAGAVSWNPTTGHLDLGQDDVVDSVVHLAGAPVAGGRWTRKRKALIRDSRIGPTRALSETLAKRKRKPRSLIVASAIGYYDDLGEAPQDETAPMGSGFLASVCQDWEAATAPASEAGIRVVHLRIGIVLHPQGGALKKMLPAFRVGAGGRIGSGKQWWSWVSLDDVLGAAVHAMAREDLEGPINVTSPNPCTNASFTYALGHALRRWTPLPMPAVGARLLLGGMANELLLASQRIEPRALIRSGYRFRDPELLPTVLRLVGSHR